MSKTEDSALAKAIHDPALFKAGDVVKIATKCENADGWLDNWITPMNGTIGMSGVVEESSDAGVFVKLKTGERFYYSSSSLEIFTTQLQSAPPQMVTVKLDDSGYPIAGYETTPKTKPKTKRRVRVGPGPWDAAPCSHLRWNLMGFFRYKLALVKTTTKYTLPDGTVVDVPITKVDVACIKCKTKMTLQAK